MEEGGNIFFLPAFGQANILQDEPTGIIDTCKNYLQTVAFVQSMIIGAAIFSSATWVFAIGQSQKRGSVFDDLNRVGISGLLDLQFGGLAF